MLTINPLPVQAANTHEFNNPESIFEIAFVDKGDGSFNWGYTGEGATARRFYYAQPGVRYSLG
jgi:hypothetical protein